MTAVPAFGHDALTLDQWQHVESLARTLTSPQARWISGYFAGLDAGLARGADAQAPSRADLAIATGAPEAASLTILYGTETGNSRELAKALGAAAETRGLTPRIADMAAYKPRALKDEQNLLIIVGTYGEGDPPQPAMGFFEFVEGARAPRLDQLRFAVLALGDSTYEKYCEAGKRLDRRLEALGATRIADRVDCDLDYDEPAAAWAGAVLDLLATPTRPTAAAAAFSPPSAHDKRNPFAATVLENIPIVGRASSKETRHLELDLSGSGLTYEPGDAIGIAMCNGPEDVAALLAATGLCGDAAVTVKGEATSLSAALERNVEVCQATPRFIDQWAKLSGSAELNRLREPDRAAERSLFLRAHHVVDIVRRFPVAGIAPDDLLAGLRPLQPRLYSLASSLAAVPDEAHVTLSPVRYSLHGEPRTGVASGLMADRTGQGDTLPVYIHSNPHFRLPADDVPIVMIGAGTGVAPYRAFLQEREVRGATGQSWLFFGERNFRSDFLYQTEWQQWLGSGVLGRMDVAFSRDPAGKVYVQHRMLERAAELYAWLEDGAHLYVCGDATAMAPDVHETLIRIVADQGAVGREGAEDYVRGLIAAQRYQRDVY
jgi:sulfite reductase (NADPH) flavoprotein alpha-component